MVTSGLSAGNGASSGQSDVADGTGQDVAHLQSALSRCLERDCAQRPELLHVTRSSLADLVNGHHECAVFQLLPAQNAELSTTRQEHFRLAATSLTKQRSSAAYVAELNHHGRGGVLASEPDGNGRAI